MTSFLGFSRASGTYPASQAYGCCHKGDRDKQNSGRPVIVDSKPNMHRWRQVKVGMSEAKVLQLLGEPRATTKTSARFLAIQQHLSKELRDHLSDEWLFGFIRFESVAVPADYNFVVTMKDGKVYEKTDPFGGTYSENGAPTIPKPLSRGKRMRFSHFPRFLDLRWQLSNGKAPIIYDVAIDVGQQTSEHVMYESTFSKKTQIPYASYLFPGMNAGRWRVRAVNSLGRSKWSEYQYFEFTV